MRVAVISDIHGNLEALEAVLNACDQADVDEIYCLGDVVGYGADPVVCLALVRERAAFVCAGNHEWAASGRIDTTGFNATAAKAARWTRDQLSAEDESWLRDLELTQRRGDALFVHGSSHEPSEFHYVFGASDASHALSCTDARIVFVGHSHRAFIYPHEYPHEGKGVEARDGVDVCMTDGRYLINVGSVGQPRDRDPRASFCVWDIDHSTLHLARAPYDVSLAQQKIIRAGLPESLANRLGSGT